MMILGLFVTGILIYLFVISPFANNELVWFLSMFFMTFVFEKILYWYDKKKGKH